MSLYLRPLAVAIMNGRLGLSALDKKKDDKGEDQHCNANHDVDPLPP